MMVAHVNACHRSQSDPAPTDTLHCVTRLATRQYTYNVHESQGVLKQRPCKAHWKLQMFFEKLCPLCTGKHRKSPVFYFARCLGMPDVWLVRPG